MKNSLLSKKPLVSIIIPTFNREFLILKTLESVINQTYTNWECIVVDDNSIDNSEEVISELAKKESRIQFYKKPLDLKKGPSESRNYGLQKSKGLFINWLDSDDLLVPEKIETDLQYLLSGISDFTISQSQFFSDEGRIKSKKWNTNLYSKNALNDFVVLDIGWSVNSSLWRRASIEKINLNFDRDLMTADDYFYHIQALAGSLKPVIIEKTLCYLREHDSRLNDYPFKASSKLKVNYYLIKNKNQLKLNPKTIGFLKNQFNMQFKSLLKHKKMKLAFFYLTKSFSYNFNFIEQLRLIKLFLYGLFFKVFGVGYRFLK